MTEVRIPIVLGVTGHRTLPDEELIEETVREQMQGLKERYPHSPFAVLSPLAEGADRLVARLAMKVLGADLLVPLPLPEALYREDFPDEAAKAEFDDLLAEADSVFELELLYEREQVQEYGPPRNHQYALAGGFIADRAQVLFAIWDGEEAAGTGGTGDVVGWVQDREIPRQYLPPESRDRPFYYPNETTCIHVHSETGTTERLGTEADEMTEILGRLDDYNRSLGDVRERKGTGPVDQSIEYVVGEKPGEAFQHPALQKLLAHYGAADALSIGRQGRFQRWLRGVYGLSALAVLCFVSLEVWKPALAGSLLFVALGTGVLAWMNREEMEDGYLHTRALAEGLRVATFWTVAGLPHHVHDHYFNKYAGELAWTRLALQNVETTCRTPLLADGETDLNATALARSRWVEDQSQYFEGTKADIRATATRFDWGAKVAYGASALTALAAAAYMGVVPDWEGQIVEYIAVGAEVLVALGVSIQAYGSKLGLEAKARHYEKAHGLFEIARRKVADPEWEERRVLQQLGREALLENGEWLWMNQTRDVETPTVA